MPSLDNRRSEIFSLGVVFYELLTGQLPFKASNEAEILFAIVNNEPPKVSKLRDDVPELVEAVVSRMLEKDLDLRYQTCGDVVHDLQGIRKEMETSTVGITGVLERVQSGRKKAMIQRLVLGIGAAAIIAIGAVLLLRSGARIDPDRIVVAILNNRTGDASLNLEGERAASWITGELLRAGIDAIPWETALQSNQHVISEIEHNDNIDPIRALAQETGAGIVVSGSIYLEDGRIRLETGATDARRGQPVLPPHSVLGGPDEISDLIRELGSRITGHFAFVTDRRVVGSGQPPSIEAYEAFSQGLSEYIQSISGGVENFYRAYEIDSTFFKPLRYACHALWNSGRKAEMDSLLGVILSHLNELSVYERCWYDYNCGVLHGDFEMSFLAMQEAVAIAPGSKAAMNYAVAASRTNRLDLAVQILKSLDPSTGAIRGWAPYWVHLSRTYHMQGNLRKAFKTAHQGNQLHPEYHQLLEQEIYALAALGRIDDVNDILHSKFLPLPDAYVWRNAAWELREHGHLEAATEVLGRLIERYKSLPAEEMTTYLGDLAWTYYFAEQWDEAHNIGTVLFEKDPSPLTINNLLGLLAARRGDREEALLFIDRLIEIHGKNKYDNGTLQYNQACIHALLGDKEEALMLLQEATHKGIEFNLTLLRDMDLESLRGYSPFEVFMSPKG